MLNMQEAKFSVAHSNTPKKKLSYLNYSDTTTNRSEVKIEISRLKKKEKTTTTGEKEINKMISDDLNVLFVSYPQILKFSIRDKNTTSLTNILKSRNFLWTQTPNRRQQSLEI
ncbi:CLUMA_CG016585, isoform A [Clunio marinus]|uniref:CLUMA_CG016585, isoform A n=1 Tax=Clunio marinus TaxID=568069 RepID=A0A1J1ISB7_9DIPT|nr:CLUMA_CG016585, isoform A [Clunio marinus]